MPDASLPDRVDDQVEDATLLAAIGHGDRRAFDRLAARHTARLLRLAWRYSGQLSAAEDIVQEALVRIWTRAAQWDSNRGSARSWMDRIVVNQCIDQGRTRVSTVDIDAIEERVDGAPDPHDRVSAGQLDRAIRDAIDALPERQRAALSLCFGRETECAEAARIMDISVAAMESLLLRGRRSVRRTLVELGYLVEA